MGVMVILGAITLDRDAASVALLRRYVCGTLAMEGVDSWAAELVVSELGTNAVDHGTGDRMAVLVAGDDERIRLEVVDGGGGGTPHVCTEAGEEDERGRGMRLVAALAEEWGVRNRPGDITVWAELAREPYDRALP